MIGVNMMEVDLMEVELMHVIRQCPPFMRASL